jgi:CheY-like chemotaxis protein
MAKLLLVEDNELNRDMLSRRLQRRGYEVIDVADGDQGLTAARRDAPDLILMDLGLPGMDGWEVTRRLRVIPETRLIPIIALTAHALSGERERAIEAGCDDYDLKPIDFPRLLGKIQSLLEKGRAP